MGTRSSPTFVALFHKRHDDMWPYRALALAVIEKAVADARGTATYGTSAHRAMARAWLRHSEDLRFWAELAGIDVDELRRAVDV